MSTIQILAICITVLVACVTMGAQAANAYVKAADLAGIRSRLDRIEAQTSEFAVLKSEIGHITSLLTEIKDGLANKQDKVYHAT